MNREDFANIKIGTKLFRSCEYGQFSRVSWSSMMSSGLLNLYKLSDSYSVIIHFGSSITISEMTDIEDYGYKHVTYEIHLTSRYVWTTFSEMNESHDCTKCLLRNYRFYWKCREEKQM